MPKNPDSESQATKLRNFKTHASGYENEIVAYPNEKRQARMCRRLSTVA